MLIDKNNSPKTKISLKQRLFLVIFGLCVCIVLLEIGLRIGGFVLLSLQEHRNRIAIRQKGAYRIMCFGDGVTAGGNEAYPSQLEDILNQRNIGVKFSVVNKAIPAIDTSIILSLLEDNLDKYNPDMVITMIGIKDTRSYGSSKAFIAFLTSLRIYKFIRLLWQNIITKVRTVGICEAKENTLFPSNNPSLPANGNDQKDYKFYIELGKYYHSRGQYRKAEKIFKKAIEIDPKTDRAYLELRWCYRMQKKHGKAEEMLKKAIEIHPKNTWTYFELGWHYRDHKKYDKAERMLKKAIEIDQKNDRAYFELGWCYRDQAKYDKAKEMFKKAVDVNIYNRAYFILIWDYIKQKEYDKAEDMLKKAIEEKPEDARFYNIAAILYEKQGRSKAAERYFRKVNRLRSRYYNSVTHHNYQKLKKVVTRRGIKLVCVQYPLRSIGPLKKMLEPIEGVVLVENVSTFRKVLKQEDHDEYFTDMFAGDFGHCTIKGHRLIAENIASAILKECFNK